MKKTKSTTDKSPKSKDPLSELLTSLQSLQDSGKLDPEFLGQMSALINDPQMSAALANDPKRMEELSKRLEGVGAQEVGSGPPLEIADYYRDGPGKYALRWDLDPSLPLPVPFDNLDRKTQFFVLFGEWSRREMQGMASLGMGQVDDAEQTFQECLARAEQIDVAELKARSYEGLVRVAQKRGDRNAEGRWNRAAQEARS